MATPQYKLIYFDLKGLGECIRYIFAYKKIKYVNECIEYFTIEDKTKSRWPAMKESMPFGQLPVLEVDGKRLTQSLAICQYLAGQHDLLTGDVWEDTLMTTYAGTVLDFVSRVAKFYYENDSKRKAEIKKELENVTVPFYLQRFENILKKKGDYFGGKITWLDFYMVGAFETINGMMGKDWVSGTYPALEKHSKRIWNLPGVKEHVAERPPYNR